MSGVRFTENGLDVIRIAGEEEAKITANGQPISASGGCVNSAKR